MQSPVHHATAAVPHMPPRLLLVEDNIETCALLRRLLRGYRLDVVMEPNEAMAMIEAGQYDLILMDINLGHGRISGLDLLHRVRRMDTYEDVPVVAVTAYALPGDRERFLEEGFTDYISKPFFSRPFLDTVAQHLPS